MEHRRKDYLDQNFHHLQFLGVQIVSLCGWVLVLAERKQKAPHER